MFRVDLGHIRPSPRLVSRGQRVVLGILFLPSEDSILNKHNLITGQMVLSRLRFKFAVARSIKKHGAVYFLADSPIPKSKQ